jgi:hypothetical protein
LPNSLISATSAMVKVHVCCTRGVKRARRAWRDRFSMVE